MTSLAKLFLQRNPQLFLGKSSGPVRACRRSQSTEPSPIVDLPGLGQLKGSYTQGAWTGVQIQQFLNIRYAEPATGSNRFKAPIPAKPWDGVRDVSVRGRGAPNYGDMKKLSKAERASSELEDCISLCVYTKDLSAKRPVAVYIHGGGFYSGSAAQHPPEYLLEKDMVLVVPQYRLAALGFLSTKSETIPGNAAIMDILLAFEWVQKNIEHFGGDPRQVTAVGQSAGAGILSALLFSPAAKESYFNRIILQSGAAFGSWLFDFNCERNARDIAKRAGCDPKAPIEVVEQFLLDLDTYSLMQAFSQHMWHGTPNGINSIGGHRLTLGGPSKIFPRTPYEVMKHGGGRRNIPMLTGVVRDEGTFALVDIFTILNAMQLYNKKDFMQYDVIEEIQRILGTVEVSCSVTPLAVKSMLDPEVIAEGNLQKMIPGLIDLCGMHLIKSTVLRSAQYNSRHTPGQTYVYSFDYRGEHTRFGYDQDVSKVPFDGGIHHTNDLLYLFPYPTSASKLNEQDTAMAKKMVDLWASFIIDGVPTTEALPEWPAFNQIFGPYLHIDKKFSIGHNFLNEFTVNADTVRQGHKLVTTGEPSADLIRMNRTQRQRL